jgi:hypothetical protein
MANNVVTNDNSNRGWLRETFSFPHPVNEYAARSVAAMVVVLALSIILFDVRWLLFVLAYGFLARVLTGPSLSPMGMLATKLIAPKLLKRNRAVAGPPKRFAQAIGLVFSVTAIVLAYGFGQVGTAYAVVGVLTSFAALEAFAGFCTGCFVFGFLMRWGIIPDDVCERCNNI